MILIVKLVGILMIVAGVVYMIRPFEMTRLSRFFLEGNRFYVGLVFAIVIGVLLLFAAEEASSPIMIRIIGVIGLLKGVLGFVFGREKFSSFVNRVTKLDEKKLRLLAGVSLLFGVIVIYAA